MVLTILDHSIMQGKFLNAEHLNTGSKQMLPVLEHSKREKIAQLLKKVPNACKL